MKGQDDFQHSGPRRRHHWRLVRDRRRDRPRAGADGYRVALLARRVDRITALADELGDGAVAIEADVTDRDALVAAPTAYSRSRGADVLVNNAGIMLLGPFSAEQRADYRRMVEVNLLGAITTTEVFLDQLKDGGGDIVNISSVAGAPPRRQRCLRGHEVGPQRLVRVAAAGAAARRPGHPHRARAVATELPTHITHAETRQGTEQLYDQVEATADDFAALIAFALSRPRRLAIHETLLRPAGQEL